MPPAACALEMDLPAALAQCAADVHPDTMTRLIRVESGFNPYAIGVVGGRLARQPRDLAEAQATARSLAERGVNFSVGLAQINRVNFRAHGLTLANAFDVCANLRAAAAILRGCFERARGRHPEPHTLLAALSCYYAGDFRRGFAHGYVARVIGASTVTPPAVVSSRAEPSPPPSDVACPTLRPESV